MTDWQGNDTRGMMICNSVKASHYYHEIVIYSCCLSGAWLKTTKIFF